MAVDPSEAVQSELFHPEGYVTTGGHFIKLPAEEQTYVGTGSPLETAATMILESTTGLDVTSAHGKDTPRRFLQSLKDMTDRSKLEFNFTTFPNDGCDEMVLEERIPFYSLCNHHVVPFHGHAWVGYVPRDKIAGLSKLARAVRYWACGLWVQEELTKKIADFLEEQLEPRGVAVVLKAEHMCMAMRGVQVADVPTTTSAMRGVFSLHTRTAKAEFMSFVQNGGRR
jgi:GTP cyclohydrolase I